jgi:flagella basal body P-ring formation protein FlgA
MIETALLLASMATGCLPVEGERITARDLSPAGAAFAALPPETLFGYAPAPGAKRIFPAVELQRLAAPHDLSLEPGALVCVARLMEPLTSERLLASMRTSLANPAARIELVEFTLFGAPRGEIEFPPAGLRRPPARDPGAAVLWHGFVRYDGRRRFPLWAKVRITENSTKVVANRDLRAGTLIEAGQVRLETSEGFPASEPIATSIEQVVGRIVRRAVAAGSPVALKLLQEAKAVERGEPVRVEASSGSARVGMVGRAVTSGSVGDTVVVRNLNSGKSFPARVDRKGAVVVRGDDGEGK